MRYIKGLIRRGVRRAGFDITRRTPRSDHFFQALRALDSFGVNFIFDVGANTGQFASELRSIGYKGEFISFEPLSNAYRALQANAAKDAKWHVYKRVAVGAEDGEIEINVAGNSVSSSVLPMTQLHSSAATNSAYVGTERVPLCKLDSLSRDYLRSYHRAFLKIDAQGFEWQVLDGAKETFPHLAGVLCELSLVSLYEGQHLWMEMIDRLAREGFSIWSIEKGFTDPRDGRTLQADAMFFRV